MLEQKIEGLLARTAAKSGTLQFSMSLPELEIEYAYSSTSKEQKFHSASVGKLFTATLILKGVEEGRLELDSRVSDILAPELLEGLFVWKGKDYKDEVTIRHLLGHTSGINDYFESKTLDGSSFVDLVLTERDRFWTPMDLLDFTRIRQQAVNKPGESFLYSDTGYILLGLILEKVWDRPFHEVLDQLIFKPAGMTDTALAFYTPGFRPEELAPIFIKGVDVHLFRSLSCDFSGGGLSTTAADLMAFLKMFKSYGIIGRESIAAMADFRNRFRPGLIYGLGMMQVRFEQFFPLFRGFPRLQGHLGVLGVHAWYDPESGDCFVLNMGNAGEVSRSFQLLTNIVMLIRQRKKKQRKLRR